MSSATVTAKPDSVTLKQDGDDVFITLHFGSESVVIKGSPDLIHNTPEGEGVHASGCSVANLPLCASHAFTHIDEGD